MSHWTIFHAGDYPRQNDGVPLEILDGGRCCFTVSEPPYRTYTRFTSPTTERQDPYRSPARRQTYCDPRCSARAYANSDSRPEYSYEVDRVVYKIGELRDNLQNVSHSQHRTRDVQPKQSVERCPTGEITDAKVAQETVENCIREMAKVKAFLEDDNSWWKILKSRSLNCCQQKVPHLHGHLDGTSVTLMLLEEDTDEVPRNFTTKKRSEEVTSSKESICVSYIERCPGSSKENQSLDNQSLSSNSVNSVASSNNPKNNPNRQYMKKVTRVQYTNSPREFWINEQEDRNNMQRSTDWSSRENMNPTQHDKRTNRSNVSPREIGFGQNAQTMHEDTLRPRERFSRENTAGTNMDFESNVDFSTEQSPRNTTGRKSKGKQIERRVIVTHK